MADLMNRIGTLFTPSITNGTAAAPSATSSNGGGTSFADMLKSATSDLNELQDQGEKAVVDMSTGEVKDLHNAALALNRAELSMKLMLEVRNKAISAYKEIQRTQL
ncbi:MAG: flagellar proximal rod protein FliE [Pseudomonadota bacterium]|jgi:flagellar hook-basal body complex protein FliE